MEHIKLYESFHNKKKLIFLIGAPGIGKSTYIKNVLSKELGTYEVINRDSIVSELVQNYNMTYGDSFVRPSKNETEEHPKFGKIIDTGSGKQYDKINKLNKQIFYVFKDNLNKYIKSDNNIIIDMTNLSIDSRKDIFKYINKDDFYKIAIVFNNGGEEIKDILLKVSKKRETETDENNKKIITPEIYKQMFSKYQQPTKSEGFDDIRFVDMKKELQSYVN